MHKRSFYLSLFRVHFLKAYRKKEAIFKCGFFLEGKNCTLGFQIDHTTGKNLHGWKNDIDNGARATEMCPDIKAIGIWLTAIENL